ncbi:hypothetical protein [Streptomyces canus]|uniref:hypothetical protein n=1 Tax=Streptomyces canus TaxID=58343 RepID=UPI0027898744|nr:hypothetical protein [Streptomyces canus]MDQ0765658.1 hypothetical protein [Streptomyces canus]
MDLKDLKSPIRLNETTELKAVFDPVFRSFSAQLWRDGSPAGLLGMAGEFTHPDDVLDAVDEFLTERGESELTEEQMTRFGGTLIMAKGGPDAAMLQMAIEHPENFIVLD